jgi:hypothetical protein
MREFDTVAAALTSYHATVLLAAFAVPGLAPR